MTVIKLSPKYDAFLEEIGALIWAHTHFRHAVWDGGLLLGFVKICWVITNLLARPELPADAQHYPEALGVLMRQCWAFKAAERPDFAQVLDALEKVAAEAGMPFDGTLSK